MDPNLAIPVPDGPTPLPLLGNYSELRGGFHDGFPKLIEQYREHGIFTISMPANMGGAQDGLFGGPTIVLAEPSLLEEMFKRPQEFNKKHFKHSPLRKLPFGKGLFTTDCDEPEHDFAARVLLPAFSLEGMKGYFEIIRECTEVMTGLLGKASGSVDLSPLSGQYTFDIICRVAFGHQADAMTKPEGCAFLKYFEKFGEARIRLSSRPLKIQALVYGLVSGDMKQLRNSLKDAGRETQNLVDGKKESLAQCPASGASAGKCPVKDMCERMLTVPDPESGNTLPKELIDANAMTFLIAGHDSTSTAITMLLYQVAQHPEVEERVHREVMEVVGDGEITWEHFSKLTYCTQVVKESLRMFPPAPQFKKVSPLDRDTTLGRYRIPKGSMILVPTFGLHYHPDVYPDPQSFNPDRWAPDEAAKRSPYAWLPFSYGPRGCIGMQLSLIEQRMILAEVVRKYHIRVDPSTKVVITQPLFMQVTGIFLRVTKRTGGPAPSLGFAPVVRKKTMLEEDGAGTGDVEKLRGKKLLVLYGSNMSTCEDFASRLLRQFQQIGLNGIKAPLNALASENPPDLPAQGSGIVLIITSTYNGQPPDNAKAFAEWLLGAGSERFRNVQFSVFGCGNRQWSATYQKFGCMVHEKIGEAGGICMAPMGEGDMDGGQAEVDLARWTLSCKVALFQSENIPLPPSLSESLFPPVLPLEAWIWHGSRMADLDPKYRQSLRGNMISQIPILVGSDTFTADVAENRELVSNEGRSTRHLEIPLTEGRTYSAGDHLGVLGANPESVVFAYLKRLGIAQDAVVRLELTEGAASDADADILVALVNKPFSAFIALTYFVELQLPATRAQLHFLGKHTTDGATKAHLQELASFDSSAYDEYVLASRKTLLEVLDEFPVLMISFGKLLALLPKNKPRYYSISSSPKVLESSVNITVSVVHGTSPTGREHLGLCSNFLKAQPRIAPGGVTMPLIAFVKDTGSTFRLPSDSTKPVIMVGPGTGLAPMRGFIQERVATGARENMLFFGCRNNDDFLYREELERWQAAGFLQLHVAFSRKDGVDKAYVQDLIAREAASLRELVARGAYVYVCGDASRMAPAVKEAIGAACVPDNTGRAADLIDEMTEQGRYCQDVWAAQSI